MTSTSQSPYRVTPATQAWAAACYRKSSQSSLMCSDPKSKECLSIMWFDNDSTTTYREEKFNTETDHYQLVSILSKPFLVHQCACSSHSKTAASHWCTSQALKSTLVTRSVESSPHLRELIHCTEMKWKEQYDVTAIQLSDYLNVTSQCLEQIQHHTEGGMSLQTLKVVVLKKWPDHRN